MKITKSPSRRQHEASHGPGWASTGAEDEARAAQLFRRLPAIDALLQSEKIAAIARHEGPAVTLDGLRVILARVREEISRGNIGDAAAVDLLLQGLPEALQKELHRTLDYSLQPVINATGVILHTNLGRAPLSQEALRRITAVAGSYSNLEFDLASGERSRRDIHLQRLLARLLEDASPAPTEGREPSATDTVVVNNCAAAVLLALNSLAEGGEVIVSRGELVEIGESFRIPDIMAKAGVILREVGSTNRTRIADYRRAINQKTRLLLRVHRSNFSITGFTEQPSRRELAELAATHNLPLMEDLGGGALLNPAILGIAGESSVSDSLRAGAGVVTYSGDKLLGGPQAGMISGRAELVSSIRGNPLFRALRVDKLTSAALEATLMSYLRGDHNAVPALRMMRLSAREIGDRAQKLADKLVQAGVDHSAIEIMDGESIIGGGAAPEATLPTRLLAFTCKGFSADQASARLRQPGRGLLPVVTRVLDGKVVVDLRTVFPEQDELLADALLAGVGSSHPQTP